MKLIFAPSLNGKMVNGLMDLRNSADVYIEDINQICNGENDYTLFMDTPVRLGVIAYRFGKETIEDLNERIKAVKEEGAAFVVACVSCVLKEEDACMKAVADAGVDYIIGYGKKTMRPYTVLISQDERMVPAFFGAGSLSAAGKKAVFVELSLEAGKEDNVEIVQEGYHPCMLLREDGEEAILIGNAMADANLEDKISMEEALLEIRGAVGIHKRLQCFVDMDEGLKKKVEGDFSKLQKTYEVRPILTSRNPQNAEGKEQVGYWYDEDKDCYVRGKDEGLREAAILCTGHIEYGRKLEVDAECFGSYNFLTSFKHVANCFHEADFIVGNLAAMASPAYPSVAEVSLETRQNGYCNCRTEFVQALKQVGFHGLAMANGYNAGLGIEGIFDTEKTMGDAGLISSGLGKEKQAIVEINGIKVGLVSVTLNCINGKNILTGEALAQFTNLFDHKRTKEEIEEVRARGAEFVLTYVHCGMNKRTKNLDSRKRAAEAIAEMGADYVICTGSRKITTFYKHPTSDGRVVPIATSIGCFLTGNNEKGALDSAMLQLYVRKDFDGSIHVDEQYIPIKIFAQHEGEKHSIMPAQEYYNKGYSDELYKDTADAVAAGLGSQIKPNSKRPMHSYKYFGHNFTIAQIYEHFGKTPSKTDLEYFGEKYNQPIPFFTIKDDRLEEGCVAIMYPYVNFGMTEVYTWDIQTCVDAKVSLVIDNKPHSELPCIVVDKPLIEVYSELANTVANWYDPVKVVVTGSMGKTTTKEMVVDVFQNHYKTLTNGGNANVYFQVGLMLQKLSETDGAFVHEVHGGTLGMASAVSKMVEPDICILTNIEKNHMSQVGTLENLIQSKISIIDGLKEGGVLIACKDNPLLKDIQVPVRLIHYSLDDESCHYFARNIRKNGDEVCFDIVANPSEFDEGGVFEARIALQGDHNIRNAIAAFAAGRQAGIPAYKIIAALSKYRTKGIRQNIVEHNGIKMILDTHNSNPAALMTMMDVFATLHPENGGKKVLVLGMMGEQGEDSLQIHYNAGKALCDYDFDLLFCFGEDAKQMVKAVKEEGREAYYFESRDLLNHMLSENVHPGDVLMVKGSLSTALDTETLIPVFGRGIKNY